MRQVGKEEASGSPGVRDSAGQPTTPPFGIKRFFYRTKPWCLFRLQIAAYEPD